MAIFNIRLLHIRLCLRPTSAIPCIKFSDTIAIGVIAESLRRSPFSVERPAPPGQWKCKLKCTISIAVAQRLRYIVSYGILSHSHSICIAFVLHCIALYGTTLYDKLYWNVPCGDTSCKTLIDVCVCVCICLSADISLNCAKNDSTDYPEIVWVCWV